MKIRNLSLGVLTALASTTIVSLASASSHREAPAISKDPAADNTDVWAWVNDGTHDTLNIVAAYNPLEEPSGGPNFHEFSDDVLYEIHVARGNTSLDDVVTYQVEFKSNGFPSQDADDLSNPIIGGAEFFGQLSGRVQTYHITKLEKGKAPVTLINDASIAPINIGPRTNAVAYGTAKYDDAYAASFIHGFEPGSGSSGRSFVGPRDDGFYVDLGGAFDLANLRAKGVAQDGVAGYNCHVIALQIPTKELTGTGLAPKSGASNAQTLGVWASASRRKTRQLLGNGTETSSGSWVQVSRLGLPLVNELLIGLQDKDYYNRTLPSTDLANFAPYFLKPTAVRDAQAVGIYAALGVPDSVVDSLKSNRTDIVDVINLTNYPTPGAHSFQLFDPKDKNGIKGITGDVLRVDMGIDSRFPNGRPITGGAQPNQEQADVTDVLLSVVLAKGTLAVKDNVDYNDKNYLTTFPYLALPWEGFSQGHGKATP